MKIRCPKNSLLKSTGISMRAVPVRTTLKILECILIDASTNTIRFTTNDMEVGIETIVEGEVIEKGIVAIDAKIFSEIIRKLPDNDITIQTDEHFTTVITCENSKFTIPGLKGDDFVGIPFIEQSDSFTISQFTLKEMIRQTIFSINMNENNPIMTGELFEIKNNMLRVVSLDGHRISIRNTPIETYCDNIKLIIPGKTLSEITRILAGESQEIVTISFSDNHILFEFENTKLVSRLIAGDYFKIDHMLSSDYETKLLINRKILVDCIDRASLLTRESDKKPLIIRLQDQEMNISIDSSFGSLNETINVVKEGKDILIGFNPKFLLDALRSINDEEVAVYLINSKAPCYIRNESDEYIYLILPININQNAYN